MKMVEEKKDLVEAKEAQLPTDTLAPWEKKIKLVRELTAKGCSDTEFELLIYTAKQYGLDPLKKQLWAIKYSGRPVILMVSRDGLLTLAWRSGQFGCMKTTCEMEKPATDSKMTFQTRVPRPVSATCEIWRKDYDKPFVNTVYLSDYDTDMALWKTKKRMMLMKCAEATTLRRAFDVSGLYVQEEISGPIDNGVPDLDG